MPASSTGRPAAVLSILVTANTRPARGSLAALDRQLAYSVKKTGAGAVALQRAATAIKFAGVGLAAGLAGSVAAAVSFEQEFANVKKTVQATPKEFGKVRKGILDLSEKIPETANSLADLAGEAGALGVKAPQLVKFTKTASMLGTATTMTSSEAADSLARLGNIMDQRSNPAFRRMGSVLVALGNKGASTESEISAMSLRIAGAGKQVGLTSAQVLGLGAALANLGIRSEMGGSAISRVLLAMNAAIAKGGSELQLWAQTADMSVSQFTETFKKDPTEAIAAFADGLGKIGQSGGDTTAVLNDLGTAAHTSMNEIRVRDTLLRVASNTDQFRTSLDQANTAWDKNNALTIEAHKRYQTLSSQLTLLKNSIVRTGIDIGTSLLPDLKEMVGIMRDPDLSTQEKVSGILDKLSQMASDAAPKLAEVGAKMTFNIAKGMVEAFGNTDNPLVKLFEAAAFVRIIGGPGALRAVGAGVGRMIGLGTVTGMSQTLAAEGAATGAAGAAGAEAGALTGMAKWKAGFFNFGKIALGGALAFGAIGGLTSTLTEDHADRSIKGVVQDFGINAFRSIGINLGTTTAEEFANSFQSELTSVAQGDFLAGGQVTNVMADAIRQKVTDRLSASGHFAAGSDALANAIETQTQHALSKASAHVPKAKELFSDIWDDMGPEDRDLARSVVNAAHGASRLLKHEHIDLPSDFIQTSPDAAKKLENQLDNSFNIMRSGALRGWDDISRIYEKNQNQITNTIGAKSKEGRQAMAQNMRAAAEALGLSMKKSGDYTKEGMDRVKSLIEQADIMTATRKQARGFAREWSTGLDHTKEVTKDGIDKVIGQIDKLPPASKQAATQAMLNQLAIAHKHNQLSDRVYSNMVSHIVAHFSDMSFKSSKKTAAMAGAVSSVVASMVNTVSGPNGFQALEQNVNKALSSFGTGKGSDKVTFSTVKAAAKAAGSFLGGLAHGQQGLQAVVPGHAAGDAHLLSLDGVPIAKVESKEGVFVGHRGLMNSLNEANSRTPRESIPRMASGGIIAAGKLAQQMGLIPSENPAFGGVTPGAHTGTSYHYSGQAIDVSGGAGPGSGQWANYVGAVRRGWLGKGLAEQFYDLLPNYVKNDQIVPGQIGDHSDHVHVAITSAVAGAMVEALKRIVLKGPKGPLRTAGQGALDKAWKQANKYLAAHAGGITGEGPVKGQYDKNSLMSLWKATGSNGDPSTMAAIALAESSGNPRADNGIARGLWQIISGTWAAYGKGSWDNAFDPNMNAQAAHAILAGGGLSQWDTYSSGAYRSFLQRGGPAWAGWFGRGGTITAKRPTVIGIGERGTETATISSGVSGRPVVVVHNHHHLSGDIDPLIATIRSEVEVALDDQRHYDASMRKAGQA